MIFPRSNKTRSVHRSFYSAGYLIFIILAGCSHKMNVNESSADHPGKASLNLSGSWELHSRSGGNRTSNNSKIQPGNGDVYTFIKNHFEHYENGKLLDSGRYELTKSKGPEIGDPLHAFVFHQTDTVLFTLQKDTLILNPRAPMYDGIATKYVRVYLH